VLGSGGSGATIGSGGATLSRGGATSGGGATSTGGSSKGGASATTGGTANSGGVSLGGSNGGAAAGRGGVSSAGGGASSGNAGRGGAASSSGGAGRGGSGNSGGTSVGTGGAGSGTCNPAAILAGFAPTDEELAEMFAEYVASELGPMTCAMAGGNGGSRTITQPIFVPPNVVYDGKGEKLTAEATAMKCDLTEGEQAESQRPYFVLAPGASVKNVTIAYPGCEGIHMLGDNVLDNISWENAGEDAASVRSYFPGGKITISNSDGVSAADKMFQFNAPCDVRIENFTGSDMGKLVRQNGDTTFELRVDLNNVTVTGVISAVVQSDSPLCYVRHHNLSYQFTGSGDKSDRVFRDVPPANVTEY
jgi:hypothetical protein